MKSARTIIALLCAAAILAALALYTRRTLEIRKLQAAVSAAQGGNVALRTALRGTSPPSHRIAPPAEPATPSQPAAVTAATAALAELQQWLDRHPEKSIPEISLVSHEICQAVAATVRSGSESDLRIGARTLRSRGRQIFGERAAQALADYASANNGALPPGMAELAPYFDPPVEEAMLRRYQILARGAYAATDANAPLIGEIAGVDDDFDSVLTVSRNSLAKLSADRTGAEIQRAMHRYLGAHPGESPGTTSALIPYLNFAINENVISKYIINNDFSISWKK